MNKTRIIVVETPFPSERPEILFETNIDKWMELPEAKKIIERTSFDLKKEHWVFVEDDNGAVGRRAEHICGVEK